MSDSSSSSGCTEVKSITAYVPWTPAVTQRQGQAPFKPPREFPSEHTTCDWSSGKALVLLLNSVPKITLVADVTVPHQRIRWAIARNNQDAGWLAQYPFPANNVPTLETNVGVSTELRIDAVGSFCISAWDDQNGNGSHDPGECYRVLNIIILAGTVASPQWVPNPIQVNIARKNCELLRFLLQIKKNGVLAQDAVDQVVFKTPVLFPGENPQYLVDLRVMLHFFGGGPAGKLGTDRLAFAGWCANISAVPIQGTYPDATKPNRTILKFVQDIDAAPPDDYLSSPVIPLAPPLAIGHGVLNNSTDAFDNIRIPDGGDTIAAAMSETKTWALLVPIGELIEVIFQGVDVYQLVEQHPFVNPPANLVEARFDFTVDYFALACGSVSADNADAGANAYCVYYGIRIAYDLRFTINRAADPPVITPWPGNAVNGGPQAVFVPLGARPEDVGCETWEPIWVLRRSVYDAAP